MRGRKRRSFDFGNFEITKREILVSVSIVAIMLLIGVLNAGKISDYQLDKNEKYNKAIKIESQELFEYGMRTTADVLRNLVGERTSESIYLERPKNRREDFYQKELIEIKRKLDDKGIISRDIERKKR